MSVYFSVLFSQYESCFNQYDSYVQAPFAPCRRHSPEAETAFEVQPSCLHSPLAPCLMHKPRTCAAAEQVGNEHGFLPTPLCLSMGWCCVQGGASSAYTSRVESAVSWNGNGENVEQGRTKQHQSFLSHIAHHICTSSHTDVYTHVTHSTQAHIHTSHSIHTPHHTYTHHTPLTHTPHITLPRRRTHPRTSSNGLEYAPAICTLQLHTCCAF